MKLEVRSPGFVDVDRDIPGMRDGGDAFEIGCDPAVRGADKDDEFRIGMTLQRCGDLVDRDAKSDVQLWMQPRREVDRDRTAQDQRDEQRFVEVARNNDFVARPNGCQQEGVIAGGRAVEQKEAAVGVPGVGRQRFRGTKGLATEMRVSDSSSQGNVAAEDVLAERVAQFFIGADAELVARRRKWHDPLPLVRDDALEEWCAVVVNRWLSPPFSSHRDRLSHRVPAPLQHDSGCVRGAFDASIRRQGIRFVAVGDRFSRARSSDGAPSR